MTWSIPEDIQKELEILDFEKKERVLRYIQREKEVGRQPSKEELLEIIHYLKGKTIKQARKTGLNIDSTSGETVALNYERHPKDYVKLFNCIYCEHQKNLTCEFDRSPLYKVKVKDTVVCGFFSERQ
jgi:hypothetical protein